MTYLNSLSDCFKSHSPSSHIRQALILAGITSLVIGILFFNQFMRTDIGVGSYAIGTAFCASGLVVLITIALCYAKDSRDAKKRAPVVVAKKDVPVLKDGEIWIKNRISSIQSEMLYQDLDIKSNAKTSTGLSFESIPEFIHVRILDFMELQDVLNLRLVNKDWKQLSNKTIDIVKKCRKHFIPFENHDIIFNKFTNAQSLTRAVAQKDYLSYKDHLYNCFQIIFREDKAYLAFVDFVQIWDSELQALQKSHSVSSKGFKMMLIGNVLHCYKIRPWESEEDRFNALKNNYLPLKEKLKVNIYHPQSDFEVLRLHSIDIKRNCCLASRAQFYLEEFGHYLSKMKFTFSENKVFAGKKNGTIAVWNLNYEYLHLTNLHKDNNVKTFLTGHEDEITHLVYQNNLLYSSAQDNKIKIWNVCESTCLRTIDTKIRNFVVNSGYICGHTHKTSNITIFKIFEQKTGNCVQSLKLSTLISDYHIHENLLIFYVNNEIRILDLNSGEILHTIELKSPDFIGSSFENLQILNKKLNVQFRYYKYGSVRNGIDVYTFDFSANKEAKNSLI